MTGYEDATRHEGARDPYGIFHRGGHKHAVLHGCGGDDEVIHLGRYDTS